MNLINKEKDKIISIVKSLRPIKYLYSKQNKDYDKYFRGSNLKDFVKQLNSQRKLSDFLAPGERLDEFDNKKTDTNAIYKNAFNYYEELSNLKKIPFSMFLQKNKTSRYNSENSKYNKNKKIKNKKTKEIKTIKLNKIKNKGDIDVTLDPGRYNPNYDYIRRRYPCAYLGKPKNEEESYIKIMLEKESVDKKDDKNILKETNFGNNKNIQNDRNVILKSEKNKNKLLYTSYSHRSVDETPNTDLKFKKIYLKNYNNIRIIKKEENDKVTSDSPPKVKTAKSSVKLLNTASSWTNTNYIENTKMDKNKSNGNSNFHFYNTQKAFKIHKKVLIKKSSHENLRCPVMFNKMQGRDRPVNFMEGFKEGNKIGYNPNYSFIRPHVPSTIFSSQRQYQEIKKYMIYKIIRSYCYNSEQYFVFNFNKNKKYEKTTKYRSLLEHF